MTPPSSTYPRREVFYTPLAEAKEFDRKIYREGPVKIRFFHSSPWKEKKKKKR